MEFHEKLDFLMTLTNTTNSGLALQIKIDASHISRLRRGQRSAPKDMACIKSMASYFVKTCKLDYQRRTLIEALERDGYHINGDDLLEQTALWLAEKEKKQTAVVGNFLAGFSNFQTGQAMMGKPQQECGAAAYSQTGISVFYGVEGKRRAAIYFLSEIAAQAKPGTLLLFSDEPTDWMTADRAFTVRWASLMRQVLLKGNRIQIIHTVSRDLDEMLNAISQWMPLYMTGLIEPYFYPKKRDGIFRRTLFISPGVSAVISNSIGSSGETAANFLFRDNAVIETFAREFHQYLGQCKPLMRIYTAKDKEAYFKTLLEFEKESSDALIKTESLSLLTMPEEVAFKIMSRISQNDDDLHKLGKDRKQLFERNITHNSFTEIIRLFDPETVKSGKVKVAFSEMLSGGTCYYSAEEYILHLEHIVSLLKKHDHFHVHLIREEAETSYMIYVREELGAIVAKISAPPVVLAINESNLTAAFWDFLRILPGEKAYRFPDNAETAKKLSAHIRRLKKSFS